VQQRTLSGGDGKARQWLGFLGLDPVHCVDLAKHRGVVGGGGGCLTIEVSGLQIWTHGRRNRLWRPDLVSMTHIGGTEMARQDLARVRWLDL